MTKIKNTIIMDYEKLYKEALNKVKSRMENNIGCVLYENDIKEIFPELKESDDEKIRKECIKYLDWEYQHCTFDEDKMKIEKCIAWLEKQNHDGKKWIYEDVYIKEKEEIYQDGVDDVLENPQKYGLEKQDKRKFTISDDALREGISHFGITQYQIDNWLKKYVEVENQCEQKPTDKVEPKFNGGDWVVDNRCGGVRQVVFLEDDGYEFQSGGWVSYEDANKHFHLWTINEAKEGDVLVASDGSLFIFAKVKNNSAYYHISLCKNGSIQISNGNRAWEVADACHPTTEEQRDFLFQNMEEAGYTWDAEKKQLIKIV